MRKILAKQFLCLLLIVWSALTATAQQSLFVGQSYRMDVSSSVMGLTANVRWSTSGGYLSLSGSGFYRDITPTQYFTGTAIVTCEWDYKLYSGGSYTHVRRQVSITCRENKVSISPTVLTLTEGETAKVSYSHAYSNAYTYYANAYFQSTNPYVCTVDAAGNVKAVGEGFAYINVYSKISGDAPYCQVTVKKLDVPATAIRFEQEEYTIDNGSTKKLQPILTPSNSTSTLKWESSDQTILSVSQNGEITGNKPGRATVTVTTDTGYSASIEVEVAMTQLTLSCNLESGRYKAGTRIYLKASHPDVRIFYWTDDSYPSENSRRSFSGYILLNNSVHLRAIATHPDYKDGYLDCGEFTVPRVSVSDEQPTFADDLTPAYVAPEIKFTESIQPGSYFDAIKVTLNDQEIAYEKQIKKNVLRIIPKTDVRGGHLKVQLPEDAVMIWNYNRDGNLASEHEWNFADQAKATVEEIDDYYFLFSNGEACRWDEEGDSMQVVFNNVLHLVDSTYYITRDNDLMGFGDNWNDFDEDAAYHILGDGTKEHRDSPVLIAKDVVSATIDTTRSLLKKDGSLWTWGSNLHLKLGTGSTVETSYSLKPVKILARVESYVNKGLLMIAKHKTTVYLYAWGDANYVGFNKLLSNPQPTDFTQASDFSTSGKHTVSVRYNHIAYGIGQNVAGELGEIGDTNPVKQMRNLCEGAERAFCGYHCTYILKTDGDLMRYGEIAHRPSTRTEQIQKVTDHVVDVKLNDEVVALLKDDNTLWMLGHQESGYFGSPTEQDTVYTEPQLVATDVKDFWLTNKQLYVRRHDDESIYRLGGEVNELTQMFPDNLRAVRDVSLPESMEMHMESEGYAQIAMTPSQATYDEILWSSTNPDVATVDAYGIIHSHGEGETEIEALVIADGYEYRSACKLKVAGENVHNEQITLSPDDWVTIYDLRGIQQYTGHYRDWVPRQKGAYVIKFGDRTITCVR